MNNEELIALGKEAVDVLMHSDADDELTHWGIKGMKWGVRRYQNPDGSLTEAGKKRKAALQKELNVLKGPKKEISEMTLKELNKYIERKSAEEHARILTQRVNDLVESQRTLTLDELKKLDRQEKKAEREAKRSLRKAAREEARQERKLKREHKKVMGKNSGKTLEKIENMSDVELANFIARKTAEKNAYGLRNEISKLNPKPQSAGKHMAEELKKSLGPVVTDAGKKLLATAMDKAVKKALGDGGSDMMKEMEKQAQMAGWQKAKYEAIKAGEQAAQAQIKTKKDQLAYDDEVKKHADRGRSWVNDTTLDWDEWEW